MKCWFSHLAHDLRFRTMFDWWICSRINAEIQFQLKQQSGKNKFHFNYFTQRRKIVQTNDDWSTYQDDEFHFEFNFVFLLLLLTKNDFVLDKTVRSLCSMSSDCCWLWDLAGLIYKNETDLDTIDWTGEYLLVGARRYAYTCALNGLTHSLSLACVRAHSLSSTVYVCMGCDCRRCSTSKLTTFNFVLSYLFI